MAPLPIVLCGKNPNVAKIVAAGLLPEFEVIHVITSAPAGIIDLPVLLAGNAPPDHSANVGSQNYTNPPAAIVVGGGYNDEEFYSMHTPSDAVKAITWLKTDNSLMKAGVGPPTGDALEEFAKKTAVKVKGHLLEIDVGKEGVKGEIHVC